MIIGLLPLAGFCQSTVRLKLPDNCDASITSSTNVTDNSEGLVVSPNPCKGNVELRATYRDVIGKITLKIYSSTGRMVYSENLYCSGSKLLKSMKAGFLSAGNYVLYFQTTKDCRSVQLIIL